MNLFTLNSPQNNNVIISCSPLTQQIIEKEKNSRIKKQTPKIFQEPISTLKQTEIGPIKKLTDKKNDNLLKKTNGFWECISEDCYPEGSLYTFALLKKCDDIQCSSVNISKAQKEQEKINKKLLFTPQHPPRELLFLADTEEDRKLFLPLLDKRSLYEQDWELFSYPYLYKLGYSMQINRKDQKTYLTVPDADLLMSRWKELKQENSQWPSLSIFSCEGIVDETTFLNAFLENEMILSSGMEFMHDQTVHIIPSLISFFYSLKTDQSMKHSPGSTFKTKQEEILQNILDRDYCIVYILQYAKTEKFEQLNYLTSFLMILIDLLTSVPNIDFRIRFLKRFNIDMEQTFPVYHPQSPDSSQSKKEIDTLLKNTLVPIWEQIDSIVGKNQNFYETYTIQGGNYTQEEKGQNMNSDLNELIAKYPEYFTSTEIL